MSDQDTLSDKPPGGTTADWILDYLVNECSLDMGCVSAADFLTITNAIENQKVAEARHEIESLGARLTGRDSTSTIDNIPSCGQENDWQKAEVPSSLLRHFCGCETCRARGQEIQRLRTERDGYKAGFNLKCAKLASARKALEPFAACVFNDNGEVTITTSDLRVHDYVRARSALTDETG